MRTEWAKARLSYRMTVDPNEVAAATFPVGTVCPDPVVHIKHILSSISYQSIDIESI